MVVFELVSRTKAQVECLMEHGAVLRDGKYLHISEDFKDIITAVRGLPCGLLVAAADVDDGDAVLAVVATRSQDGCSLLHVAAKRSLCDTIERIVASGRLHVDHRDAVRGV
jgi:hypothetical protein